MVHKTYQLYLYLYECISLFPKRDRYTLGVRIEGHILEFFELIMLAREKNGPSKFLILKKADYKLKVLKLFVRMAYDIKSLPEKRYIRTEEMLIESGKMLGGWIKQNTKGPAEKASPL